MCGLLALLPPGELRGFLVLLVPFLLSWLVSGFVSFFGALFFVSVKCVFCTTVRCVFFFVSDHSPVIRLLISFS